MADSTGWLQEAAAAGESIHGILLGIDEAVYQLESHPDLSDRLVEEAVQDDLKRVGVAVTALSGHMKMIELARDKLVDLVT